MESSIPIFTRSSGGISAILGPPQLNPFDKLPEIQSKSCRTLLFSPDGSYLAYVNGATITLIKTDNSDTIATIENTKAYHLAFSPKSSFLMSWEPFTVSNANPQGSPNLKIYKTDGGELVKSFIQKKQVNWEPQWSNDEKLFTRLVNTDVVFYEDLNFERIVTRITGHKVASYKLSPNVGTYFILCHTLGSPGQPSFGRLFKYPNFENALANKSFFQADKVEFLWNSKGNNALLLTSTEVDKTGGSYYGKQGLHFIGLNGQTAMVTLSKEGPIYSVQWSPKNQEFCVIYGFMPAKTTIFNLKCEPCFELGTGARNSLYYNPHGNLLLVGGFGNLRGQIEVWDAIGKKKIGCCEAADSTLLQWAANGEHFLTATTAPRLRIANGFKIWHYTGSLLYEHPWPQGEELYDVTWKPYPKQAFKEPQISDKKVDGIASSQPQASKEVYRPPSARNRPTVNFKLHNEDEDAHNVGSHVGPSKAALENKKKREAKKVKQSESTEDKPVVTSGVLINLTGDPELDKKLKNIKKKLDAIEKLKIDQAAGKVLEANQLTKIEGERALLEELDRLKM
ncbi:eukaryotic translation initiation factor 2A [Anthonomus grandis grandis]|uniref:eukaryotic translation initiation factor 2A n=1 Tax=Anthonomus grandis grandis TaxID=2921223 RepID=UPI0021657A3F|nr:eukaryotic translation initiation factor 2A [Anthonomus grandis grandis]